MSSVHWVRIGTGTVSVRGTVEYTDTILALWGL